MLQSLRVSHDIPGVCEETDSGKGHPFGFLVGEPVNEDRDSRGGEPKKQEGVRESDAHALPPALDLRRVLHVR